MSETVHGWSKSNIAPYMTYLFTGVSEISNILEYAFETRNITDFFLRSLPFCCLQKSCYNLFICVLLHMMIICTLLRRGFRGQAWARLSQYMKTRLKPSFSKRSRSPTPYAPIIHIYHVCTYSLN